MNAVFTDATYGCDAVGLVCGVRFTRDGAGHSTAALALHLLRDQAGLLIAIVQRTSAEVDALEDAFPGG